MDIFLRDILPVILTALFTFYATRWQVIQQQKNEEPVKKVGIVAEMENVATDLTRTVGQMAIQMGALRREVTILWDGARENAIFIESLGFDPPFKPNGHLLEDRGDNAISET